MAVFNDRKVKTDDLLGVISEVLLSYLSSSTKVDYCLKIFSEKI